jgi:hypothetical protein
MKKVMKFWIPFIVFIIIYMFLAGGLMPMSPFVLGFNSKVTDKAVIYYHKNADLSVFADIDALASLTEAFHGINFDKKIEIVVCTGKGEYKRLTSSKELMITYPVYGRIIVSDAALDEFKKGRSIKPYLLHELSHSLFQQHLSITQSISFPRWILQGSAVASSSQMGSGIYYSKNDIRGFIGKGIFFNPDDYGTRFQSVRKKIKKFRFDDGDDRKEAFFGSEFACVIEDLIERYGKDKFAFFLKEVIRNGKYKEAFKDTFGIEFDEYLVVLIADIKKQQD